AIYILIAIYLPSFFQTPFLFLSPFICLDCYLQGYNAEPWMYWYWQPPQGGALHMLFLSRVKGSIDDSLEKHFIAARPAQQNFTLSTDSLFPNDTGLYYCAWSRTLSQAGAASGQKLPLPLSL
uniref:Ig-like domain-containing protein n=1 Tax=Chrysemys picta bellii TaxID=8478 RepID=A0A8C3HFZ0_CHRPI